MPRRVLQETDPLPKQVDAEPRFTMSGMGLVVQGSIGGLQIALEEHIDATADVEFVNERLDFMARAIGRQKAKSDLVEKIVALQANREMVVDIPNRRDAALRKNAADKAAHYAGLQARWQLSGKRTEYQPSRVDETNLKKFDDNEPLIVKRFEEERDMLLKDQPLIEVQIRRLRAIVDGADPTKGEPLSEAAE